MRIRLLFLLLVTFVSAPAMQEKVVRFHPDLVTGQAEPLRRFKWTDYDATLQNTRKKPRKKRTFYRAFQEPAAVSAPTDSESLVHEGMIRVVIPSLIVRHFSASCQDQPLPEFTGADYAVPLTKEYIDAARACYAIDPRVKGYCDDINLYRKEIFTNAPHFDPPVIKKEIALVPE